MFTIIQICVSVWCVCGVCVVCVWCVCGVCVVCVCQIYMYIFGNSFFHCSTLSNIVYEIHFLKIT